MKILFFIQPHQYKDAFQMVATIFVLPRHLCQGEMLSKNPPGFSPGLFAEIHSAKADTII